MSKAHHIAMLGTGFIADFYTGTLHSQRTMDRVHTGQREVMSAIAVSVNN